METTFMSIHNLTPEANILFASESIVDILGFLPEEVTGKSCFDYFHPDEVPFARHVHSRGVQLDKAAVLHYARIRDRNGDWIGCECVFTIVYEVLVACTSVYKGDIKSQRRAIDAPTIRRLFASSPRDPRYHMLEHLSAKFRAAPQPSLLEPRAALILNRFTRTLTVMYATNAVSSLLGITPEQFKDKSFYECMQENCLPEAIRCLESAKANDSIAYLRFWYRDPRRPEDLDQEMREASQSSDSDDGGVVLSSHMDHEPSFRAADRSVNSSTNQLSDRPSNPSPNDSRTYSDQSTDLEHDAANMIFERPQPPSSSTSSLVVTPDVPRQRPPPVPVQRPQAESYELEAVVSCTSDGLVVILRRARPLNSTLQQPAPPPRVHVNGLFAAPWGANPIRPHQYRPDPRYPFHHGLQAPPLPVGGPPLEDFMISIREVAVFAWSLAGINGNIASYGHGRPLGEAQPPTGLPIWDPYAQPSADYFPPQNQAQQRWTRMGASAHGGMGGGMGRYSSRPSESLRMISPSHEKHIAHMESQYYQSPVGQMGGNVSSPMEATPTFAYDTRVGSGFQPQQNQGLWQGSSSGASQHGLQNMSGGYQGQNEIQQQQQHQQQQQQQQSDPSHRPYETQGQGQGQAPDGQGGEGDRGNRYLWY